VIFNPDQEQWDTFVTGHRDGHAMQYSDWGRLQTSVGSWFEIVAVCDDQGEILAGAQILFHHIRFRLAVVAYIPAGPLFYSDAPSDAVDLELLNALDSVVHRKHRASFLKVEPCDWFRPRPDLPDRLTSFGFQPSKETLEPPRTIVIDITPDEDILLKRMNQSTRYKVRFAAKNGVQIRVGKTLDDIASFNRLLAVTSERDGFEVKPPHYYQTLFELFSADERCGLLLASYEGEDLAGILILRCGAGAYYIYGASNNENRKLMPNYLLQWEGMRWAKQHGACWYDLWGIQDSDPEVLEREFQNQSGDFWRIYRFKRGFGGKVVRSVGAWDKPYNALVYAAYLRFMLPNGDNEPMDS
jgi:peptidoglycan pentaglycine glycine transferase (the first glycine)